LTALADAGVALPTGWLREDGGTYSRTTYANLFAAVTGGWIPLMFGTLVFTVMVSCRHGPHWPQSDPQP
jgi:hypothetical protein